MGYSVSSELVARLDAIDVNEMLDSGLRGPSDGFNLVDEKAVVCERLLVLIRAPSVDTWIGEVDCTADV